MVPHSWQGGTGFLESLLMLLRGFEPRTQFPLFTAGLCRAASVSVGVVPTRLAPHQVFGCALVMGDEEPNAVLLLDLGALQRLRKSRRVRFGSVRFG